MMTMTAMVGIKVIPKGMMRAHMWGILQNQFNPTFGDSQFSFCRFILVETLDKQTKNFGFQERSDTIFIVLLIKQLLQ